MRSDNRQHGQR